LRTAGPPPNPSHMKSAALFLLVVLTASCSDLTAPLPSIAGTWQYTVTSPRFISHNRTGTIRIVDDDPRTARFDGSYTFHDAAGESRSGLLTGAFITRDSIWFRFIDTRFEVHEAKLLNGSGAGEIFFLTQVYETSGSQLTLHR